MIALGQLEAGPGQRSAVGDRDADVRDGDRTDLIDAYEPVAAKVATRRPPNATVPPSSLPGACPGPDQHNIAAPLMPRQ